MTARSLLDLGSTQEVWKVAETHRDYITLKPLCPILDIPPPKLSCVIQKDGAGIEFVITGFFGLDMGEYTYRLSIHAKKQICCVSSFSGFHVCQYEQNEGIKMARKLFWSLPDYIPVPWGVSLDTAVYHELWNKATLENLCDKCVGWC